jgi:hypothetical protein
VTPVGEAENAFVQFQRNVDVDPVATKTSALQHLFCARVSDPLAVQTEVLRQNATAENE